MSKSSSAPEDSATAWVAVLERARSAGDFELMQRANRELERLGVKITFDERKRRVRDYVSDYRKKRQGDQ